MKSKEKTSVFFQFLTSDLEANSCIPFQRAGCRATVHHVSQIFIYSSLVQTHWNRNRKIQYVNSSLLAAHLSLKLLNLDARCLLQFADHIGYTDIYCLFDRNGCRQFYMAG